MEQLHWRRLSWLPWSIIIRCGDGRRLMGSWGFRGFIRGRGFVLNTVRTHLHGSPRRVVFPAPLVAKGSTRTPEHPPKRPTRHPCSSYQGSPSATVPLAGVERRAEICSTGEMSARVPKGRRVNSRKTHTTKVAKVAFEFATPCFTWERRGRLYVFGWFGGFGGSGLRGSWRVASVRIVDPLDVG